MTEISDATFKSTLHSRLDELMPTNLLPFYGIIALLCQACSENESDKYEHLFSFRVPYQGYLRELRKYYIIFFPTTKTIFTLFH